MGYTRYWTPAKDKVIPTLAIAILTTMLEYGKKEGIIESDETNNQCLQISPEKIFFNGVGDNAHETFSYYPNSEWDFCKTARKPYDLYVCATLIVLKYFTPGLDFSSDGVVESGEWLDAISFLLENREDFNLPRNLVDSLLRIRAGEDGDLFQDFPLFKHE